MANLVGQQLGSYRLLKLLGRGSFAEVYMGEHLHLNTPAAIKVLHTRFTDELREQFYTEARTIARLAHPNIVRVLDFDVENGIPYLVMEYASNSNLRQRHPKGTKVPLDTIIPYVKQLAEALDYIHNQELIHCDVKPESILLGRNNEVLLSEFGIATIVQSSRSHHTREIAGTIAYIAPEQLHWHPLPASDQYALAVVVYEWLSGERPFSGDTTEKIATQHLFVPPPSLRAKVPAIPPAVEQVVFKALAKDPQQRFASVQAFAIALEESSRTEQSKHSAEVARSSPSVRDLPTGTVTLLFTDIEGSTHLLQQLGDDRYNSVLSECKNLLRAVFREWSGHEVDTQGDAFFVVFARAMDAVLAATEAQRTLFSHPWPEGVTMRLRMGIHTGEPQRSSEGYVGLDVHRAARIMSAGHGGQVLLSQTTCNLVEQDLPDDMSLLDLGEHRLKDLGRSRRIFQLVVTGLPAEFPPLKTLNTAPNNLPVQPTPFIGREHELATVENLLRREDVRLLTLTGPGGSGKTRLGLQVAAELSDLFPDGVFFVNLASINDPSLVVTAIVETLGIREKAGQALVKCLQEELRQKHMLLLLDNFEQVISAAEQVAVLLAACPQLKVLVTSREVLHVRAEHEFTVPPLALPDPRHLPDIATLTHYASVALFLQRAQAVKPDFQLTEANARATAEICTRLDGLPLAIELAAARIKLLSPQALLARLGQRLAVLTGGTRDAPARQQTLRNTIKWSYDLLDAQEQRLFRRLSVFVGGCSLDAIEAVCQNAGDEKGGKLDIVASLIDKSLVRQVEQEAGESRLVMLETIREYGLEVLEATGELVATRQVHAMYYLQLTEEVAQLYGTPEEQQAYARLERVHENLRASLQFLLGRQEAELALRLCNALWWFWLIRSHISEGRILLELALTADMEGSKMVRADALNGLGLLLVNLGDYEQAERRSKESLTLCRELGDIMRIGWPLHNLGLALMNQGRYTEARAAIEEGLAFFRQTENKAGIAYSLSNLTQLYCQQAEYVMARACAEESLALFRALENAIGIISTLLYLTQVIFFSQGEIVARDASLEECLSLAAATDDEGSNAEAHLLIAQIALSQGNISKAHLLVEESLAFYRSKGYRASAAEALVVLGQIVTDEGDVASAQACFEESLMIARETHYQPVIAPCLEGLARLSAVQGAFRSAARLWGAAEALRDAMNTPIPPIYRASYERLVSTVRTHLGERNIATAWAQGRVMTLEQALASLTPMEEPISRESSKAQPVKSPISFPDRLTAREAEVLRLVAKGLMNDQVAEQLVISPRTVNTHLTSIYGKIGVSSRSAATRYAIEHHLV